jgi:hypothetical protein
LLHAPLLAGAATATAAEASEIHQFQGWQAERERLERLYERIPEPHEALRDQLLDSACELRQRIIETPSRAASVILMKAQLLLWYMEQERSDDLPAMQHICAFLESAAR